MALITKFSIKGIVSDSELNQAINQLSTVTDKQKLAILLITLSRKYAKKYSQAFERKYHDQLVKLQKILEKYFQRKNVKYKSDNIKNNQSLDNDIDIDTSELDNSNNDENTSHDTDCDITLFNLTLSILQYLICAALLRIMLGVKDVTQASKGQYLALKTLRPVISVAIFAYNDVICVLVYKDLVQAIFGTNVGVRILRVAGPTLYALYRKGLISKRVFIYGYGLIRVVIGILKTRHINIPNFA